MGTCTALPALGTDSVSNSMEMKEIKGRGGKVKKNNKLTCGKSNEEDTENMMVENKKGGGGV